MFTCSERLANQFKINEIGEVGKLVTKIEMHAPKIGKLVKKNETDDPQIGKIEKLERR